MTEETGSDKSSFGKAVSDVLSSFMASAHRDADAAFADLLASPAAARATASAKSGDVDAFEGELLRPTRTAIDALLRQALPGNHRAQFLFRQLDYVKALFRDEITRVEGTSCCADKTGFVVRRLAKALVSGEPVNLTSRSEYTFMIPDTVFTDHESINKFFDAIYFLHCGRPEKFLAYRAAPAAGPGPSR
jgi:DNA-binding phage protein